MEISVGKKVRIGDKRPEVVLPDNCKGMAIKHGNATIREIVPAGTVFPPMKMFRYYKIEPHDPRFPKLQEAKPFDRIVLQLEETMTVEKKRRGKMVDTERRMYTVLPKLIFEAFCYEVSG